LLGALLAPRSAGSSTWLPETLRQQKETLVAMTHASWDEPRLLVELPYAGHLLCYCAQHELLVVREPTGSLRQLHTAAEFAALTSKTGIVTLQAQY
jgi:hypothetical protein